MINGEFLSHLSSLLCTASHSNLSEIELVNRFSDLVNNYYNSSSQSLPMAKSSDSVRGGIQLSESLAGLPAEEMERLSILLPWSSYNSIDGFRLGNAYNDKKRNKPTLLPDSIVAKLNDRRPLNGINCIESGCFEGQHSISLAFYGAKVYSFDARIENVIKSLVRVWAFSMQDRVSIDVLDLEKASVHERYRDLFSRDQSLGLYHCRGVLYHLKNPIQYLEDVARLKPAAIYIHTQIATTEQAQETIASAYGEFRAYKYREKGRTAPFAGLEAYALWLTEDSLFFILRALGYGSIAFSNVVEERNGLRIELLAEPG